MIRAASILVAIALVGGCGDATTTAIDVGPTGPPSIELVDPASAESPVCVSLGQDAADLRVPMLVELGELVLRHPGGCGTLAQCGHLALFVVETAIGPDAEEPETGSVFNNESAVPSIDLLTRKLAYPYHDGTLQADGTQDYLHIRVKLIGDDGLTALDHDDLPLADDVDLITVPDCAAL